MILPDSVKGEESLIFPDSVKLMILPVKWLFGSLELGKTLFYKGLGRIEGTGLGATHRSGKKTKLTYLPVFSTHH